MALRFFYRRVYITGVETVPIHGPAIIVCNHPSSLMDAALLGVLLKRKLFFFARGDVFASRFATKMLRALHMLPVHNHEGGRATLDKNNDAFSEGRQILANGGVIVFFPEGSSHVERQLYPMRKGIFRLAFQAAAESGYTFEIPIIPVGISYDDPIKSQQDVTVHIGTPLMLGDYRQQFDINNNAALLKISKDCYAAMFRNVLHVDDPSRFATIETHLCINRNDYQFYTKQWAQATRQKFENGKDICQRLNAMEAEEFEILESAGHDYRNQLKKNAIDDRQLSDTLEKIGWGKKLFLLMGWPFFIVGYLLNALPLLVAKRIADTRVTRLDFYTWIMVASSALLGFCWYLLLFLGFLIVGWKCAAAVVLLAAFTGVIAHQYLLRWRAYHLWNASVRIKKQQPDSWQKLELLRNTIKNAL